MTACVPVVGNFRDVAVRWVGHEVWFDGTELPVSGAGSAGLALRFLMRGRVQLYSFWFV